MSAGSGDPRRVGGRGRETSADRVWAWVSGRCMIAQLGACGFLAEPFYATLYEVEGA